MIKSKINFLIGAGIFSVLSVNAFAQLSQVDIDKRIELNRKGNLTIKIKNSNNLPVSNAVVKVTQTQHEFLFGSNLFELNDKDNSKTQLDYQNAFKEIFNEAALPFFWGAYEYNPRQYNTNDVDAKVNWCLKNGIKIMGTPMVYHLVYPYWAPQDPVKAVPEIHYRNEQLIKKYRNNVSHWIMSNELTSAADHYGNGISNWVRRDGAYKVLSNLSSTTKAVCANNGVNSKLIYNDFKLDSSYFTMLANAQKYGTLPDALGIQSHMQEGNWTTQKVWDTCQAVSIFKKPLHFTEMTVVSAETRKLTLENFLGTVLPWNWVTNPMGEKTQADNVEKYYSVLFSHPSVESITWWDFSDKNAWMGAPSGLLRKDMSRKPAYDRLKSLIKGKWWTNLQTVSNANGTSVSRVFYGKHVVSVSVGGKLVKNFEVLVSKTQNPNVSIEVTVP